MIKLYDYDLSGSCYKARLLLGFLGVEYARSNVDMFPGFLHLEPAFRAISPQSKLPVLEQGDLRLTEANAILVYLAKRYDPSGQWLPQEAGLAAEVQQWLSFADALTDSAGAARLGESLEFDVDEEAARAKAGELFDILDEHLWFNERAGRDWICATKAPTIADVACFPDVILSEEGGVSRADFPALRRWTDRFKRLPDFVNMPGVFHAVPGV